MQVAAARIEITPLAGMPLLFAGQVSAAHKEVLESNALWLQETGFGVILVSADILFFSAEDGAWLKGQLAHVWPQATELLLLASHTHYMVGTDPEKQELGIYHEPYHTYFRQQLLKLLHDLITQEGEVARLKIGQSEASLNINRRRKALGWVNGLPGLKTKLLPNPTGQVDPTLTVITIEVEGKCKTALVHYACHPTAYPLKDQLSAEYPAYIRRRLRQTLGDIPVLFLQGFAGDIRPAISPKMSLSIALRMLLNQGPVFGTVALKDWQAWSEKLADYGHKALLNCEEILSISMSHSHATLALTHVFKPLTKASQQMRLSATSLADRVVLLTMGAETCIGYAKAIQAQYPNHTILCVGYESYCFGYLPTQRMVAEGGYEVEGFQAPFGMKGSFQPDAEQEVLALAKQLIDEVLA